MIEDARAVARSVIVAGAGAVRRRACAVVALALFVPLLPAAGLAAQQPADVQRARSQLPAAEAKRFDALLSSARRAGIPLGPLVDKALEGEAKGVAPARILSVIERLSGQLGVARQTLGARGSPADVAAVADAMQRGVPGDAVRRIADAAGPGAVALPVHTVADLMQQGVPAAAAVGVVQAWQGRHRGPSELRDAAAAVARLIRQGDSPAQAAESVAEAVRKGRHTDALVEATPKRHAKPRQDVAPGHGRENRPPIAPGTGPPPGKGKGHKSKPPQGPPPHHQGPPTSHHR